MSGILRVFVLLVPILLASTQSTQKSLKCGTGRVVLIIPAFQPAESLLDVVRSVAGSGFAAILVVDDGSAPACRPIFDEVQQQAGVRLLRHAVNLGKGAALKTAMNYALVEFPDLDGVVTADADGQHAPEDICAVARMFGEHTDALVLGARAFSGPVPLRSRFGNELTRTVMRLVVGHRLTDTQTGLRAIPRGLAERLLKVPASGYEFELEMLIAAKHLGIEVLESPIQTIYQKGNPTSHFQPLRDSMRIYFVLLRFGFMSIATAALDNIVFYILFHTTGALPASLLGARVLALLFNYTLVRNAVFLSHATHKVVFPRYLLLAAANVCFSFALITSLTNLFSIAVMPTKILVESILFIANFAIQRDFVFARRTAETTPA